MLEIKERPPSMENVLREREGKMEEEEARERGGTGSRALNIERGLNSKISLRAVH